MCGRFTLAVEPEALMVRYHLQDIPFPFQQRYNISPGQYIPAVISNDGVNRVGLLRWGLVHG
ncbi:hypothetical protein BCE02nite_56030 [Brevibacillus centrosporus]|uniref:SOS response-associated peptidase family protein n=1 Tax=Brevibacillus centrosporus TaxID=54910 RepID=UPI00114406F9|nr:hypothetical protein BCE02nite_56030 [Brevibacillus centrosporus]